jgi:signal transduction histidine kinase
MKLGISLRTRFTISTTFLLIVLVGSILFVIQRREVRTIIEESKNQGILIAKNIAYLNLQPLLFWDREILLRRIDEQISPKVIFVIFYDRNSKPFVANDLIRGYTDFYNTSRLQGEVRPDDYFFASKTLNRDGKTTRILEIEVPIFTSGSPTKWGSIKIGQSLEEMEANIRKTRGILILIGMAGLFIGVAGATLLARRITTPLKKLVQGTVKISKGDFSHRIDLRSQDEIGNLARSFNDMTGDLLRTKERMEAANRQLIQAEKLASIGRLSATIAHEIRNPLTSVKLNIQKIVQDERLDDIGKEHLSIAQEGISHIEKFIKELLNFTRVSQLNLDLFSVEQIAEESFKMMRDCFQQKGIIVEKTYQHKLPQVLADGDKLRQVFMSILRNACEAVEDGGKVSLSVSLAEEGTKKKIKIQFSDNGPGIPESKWETIFEPFFTTKASGFGLGLANARKIIEQHNGVIKVVKKESPGVSFVVLIPCEEGP